MTKAQRLVRKHEQLEALLDARRRHGQPAPDLWLAMVRVEDLLRAESPRSYSHWLSVWLTRQPRGSHPIGGYSADCLLCHPRTVPGTKAGAHR